MGWFHKIDKSDGDDKGKNYGVGLELAENLGSCMKELAHIKTCIYKLETFLNTTAFALKDEFGCAFETESGIKCMDLAVGEARGIPCCEYHSRMRLLS